MTTMTEVTVRQKGYLGTCLRPMTAMIADGSMDAGDALLLVSFCRFYIIVHDRVTGVYELLDNDHNGDDSTSRTSPVRTLRC